MNQLNLTLNALSFDHLSDELPCFFKQIADDDLSQTDLLIPKLIEETGISSDKLAFVLPDTDNKYTNAIIRHVRPGKGTYWSIPFLKAYYQFRLKEYFLSAGLVIKQNFLHNPEVWVVLPETKNGERLYNRFELRVQCGRFGTGMELLIAYLGKTTVMNTSVSDYIEQGVDPDCFNQVIHQQTIASYKYLSDEMRRDTSHLFPKPGFRLKKQLNIPFSAPDKSNHYLKYRKAIDDFRATYLKPEQLSHFLRLSTDGYITKEAFQVETDCRMVFGNNNQGTEPKYGFKNGPALLPPSPRVQLFYIMHKEDKQKALTIHQSLISKLREFTKMDFFVEKDFSIVFEDKSDPLPEIRKGLEARQFLPDRRYVAFYLSPYNKHQVRDQPGLNGIYYRVKEELHNRDIVTQTVEIGRAVTERGFIYWTANIASALVAKLGGVPWMLPAREQEDLIVGVGAFTSHDHNCRYVGSAFSFTNDGRFYGFECFRSNEVKQLAGSIVLAIREFRKNHARLNRLIIHFYKEMSNKEVKAVYEALNVYEPRN